MIVESLKCEFRTGPLGVDLAEPRLSWVIRPLCPDARNVRQSAFEILVARTSEQLDQNRPDFWHVKTTSSQSLLVPYRGTALTSGEQVFWKVRVWDDDGNGSTWSPTATWTAGLLTPADWSARWIGAEDEPATTTPKPLRDPTVLLRRDFGVRPGLKRALIFVCGLGQYELTVNGKKSGIDLLSPGWTDYRKTCLYDTHDVTALLQPGTNAVGLFLGGGMYDVRGGRYAKFIGSFGAPKAIAHMRLTYDDGGHDIIGTDDTWQACAGPITFCDVYGGEDHDARQEQRGWDSPGGLTSAWTKALVVTGPGGALRGVCSAPPPVRAFESFKPVQTRASGADVVTYDFGQNASIVPRITVRGPRGARVRLIPAELLQADGTPDMQAAGGPCYWQYTIRGDASETWFPRFYYRGARYLRVEAFPADGETALPEVTAIESVVVHSDCASTGDFSCSNDLFNRIRSLVRWAQLSNIVSIVTDCPHREKLGWLEQYHVNGPALRYEWDLAALFAKGLSDMADAQTADGLVPDIAPEYVKFEGGFRDSPEWGSAVVLTAWQHYLFQGDIDLLRRHYPAMTRYVAYLATKAKDNLLDHGLGDWYDIGPKPPGPAQLTPRSLTASAIYYEDLEVMTQVAGLLGNAQDQSEYARTASDVRRSFIKKFRDPATGRYATGSQTANAMVLVLGLIEPADRQPVLDAIVKDIRDRGSAISSGDIGYRYLLRALADNGRSDVIYEMNNQSEKPGYGYQLKRGATSLTEAWDASPRSSQNHFMLGQIIEWMYHDVAGIQYVPAAPGYQKIVIRPAVIEGLAWVTGSYRCGYGTICSAWRREGHTFTLNVKIPANTTATVVIPMELGHALTESGKPLPQSVKCDTSVPGAVTIEIGSGNYSFRTEPKTNG